MTGGMDEAAYRAVLEYLYSLRRFGTKPGLERIRELLDRMGAPDRKLTFLHIAGTNGKGSAAAMLAAMLQAAGVRTGLYTSPHLVEFTERIQVDGEPVSWEEAYEGLQRIKVLAADLAGGQATFFEIVTALAAEYFVRRGCEVVVWETGMGGRLDATNAVETSASIITPIGRDHCEWLGDTIAAIAGEKAGIIRTGVPVFTSVVEAEALEVIERVAGERGAKLTVVCREDELRERRVKGEVVKYREEPRGNAVYELRMDALGLDGARLGLCGRHQVRNGALAAVVGGWYLAMQGMNDWRSCVREGLANAKWPGRFQILHERPLVVVDCAHNAHGMAALGETLREFGEDPWIVAMGVMADKELDAMVRALPPVCQRIWYVGVRNARALGAEEFCVSVARARPDCVVAERCGSVEELVTRLRGLGPGERVIVTGSCYLVGEVLSVWRGEGREERADDPVRHVETVERESNK